MALSDCPKCWDTPCECGNFGYMIVYPDILHADKIKNLSSGAYQRIRAKLRKALDEELAAMPDDPSVARKI